MFEDALLFIKTQFYKLGNSLLEDDSDQKEYEQQLIKEVEDLLLSKC